MPSIVLRKQVKLKSGFQDAPETDVLGQPCHSASLYMGIKIFGAKRYICKINRTILSASAIIFYGRTSVRAVIKTLLKFYGGQHLE